MAAFLIYGASGYSGRLIAEHAVSRGLRPILAGRSRGPVEELAQRLNLEWRSFDLTDADAIRHELLNVDAVLNAAGPFSSTARPMIDACLVTGTHYTDITGEIDVFESAAALDAQARAAGVMLLPGVGFDVVPSDCLAAHVAAQLPDAHRLLISIGGLTEISRGTAKTMLEAITTRTRLRRDGKIVESDRPLTGTADFGEGERETVGMSWGDVSTAWYSTRIPNIEVRFEATALTKVAVHLPGVLRKLLGSERIQQFLKGRIDRHLPPGPSPEQRARGRCALVAEVWNERGDHRASRLIVPEAYSLTAVTAVESVQRALTGAAKPGFQTPSTAYGADYITVFEGVSRTDVVSPETSGSVGKSSAHS